LQSFIDTALKSFKEQDRIAGNGAGEEVLEHLRVYFRRAPPPQHFPDFEEFMKCRVEDAAVPYVTSQKTFHLEYMTKGTFSSLICNNRLVFACVKFSLGSSIIIESPKLAKFIQLAARHIAIVNDLGSWKKEKQHYDSGNVLYLLNTVDAVGKALCLDEDSAIEMAYALQLQTECQIDDELEHLINTGVLDEEDWRFIDGVLLVLSGNVLTCVVMSRYGGEVARL
jgi:hypothetical protein